MTTERDLRVGTATRGPGGSLPATSEFGRRVISARSSGKSEPTVDGKSLADWAASDEPLIDDEGNELPVGRRTSHVLRSADQEILDAPDLLASEQTPDLSSSWDQLRNTASRTRNAKADFISTVAFREEVIKAEEEAAQPWIDPRKEIAFALWGATVDASSETFIMAKDLSRAVLPFDKLLAGIAFASQGENFFAGAAEADADNNRVNEDIRAGADSVTVGSTLHPMTEEHHIEWIELLADGKAYRQFLTAGDEPIAEFKIKADEVTAREHCNVHGLWKG